MVDVYKFVKKNNDQWSTKMENAEEKTGNFRKPVSNQTRHIFIENDMNQDYWKWLKQQHDTRKP